MPALNDSRVVVTGGANGIGRAIALRAARDGASVVIGDIDTGAGEALAAELVRQGSKFAFVHLDTSDSDSVEQFFEHADDFLGGLNAAVNCAGISSKGAGVGGRKTAEIEEQAWARIMDVNLTGTWLCLRAEIERMLRHGHAGSIVNISSTAGYRPLAMASAYSATKHAVLGLTKAAALEYGEAGIRINAVCPGFIDTQFLPPTLREQREVTPLGRIGNPDEVAALTTWLLSNEASYAHGGAYTLDGGLTA